MTTTMTMQPVVMEKPLQSVHAEGRARWERPAHALLLLATAAAYLWNLSASGWANSFYSAAVQAGSVSWKAFFFGSSDAANSITVDKPPASLWPMELMVRVFGLNSWSILIPEALMGVATVAVLYACIRRHFSAEVALLAGGVLALTPVAALMFKFNNPDALLVLLLTVATTLTIRAIETGRVTWLIWAGVAVGFGFLTKQMQAFLVLPALVTVYAIAAPRPFAKRVRDLLAAFAAMIVSAGWWVAIVELTPASMRPYVGGSQHNSFLELTFGYNGLGRLTGSETGSVTPGRGGGMGQGGPGGPGGNGSMWGSTGIFRMFENEIGGQISWLLPATLVLGLLALWLIRSAPRTDTRRATVLAFGGVLVTTLLAFSFMAGIFHAYYTVALAPYVAAVFAIGAGLMWQQRQMLWIRIVSALLILGTAAWAWVLLDRASSWVPGLKVAVAVLATIAAVLWLVPQWSNRWFKAALAATSLAAVLIAPSAYTFETVTTGHHGAIVTAGPAIAGGMGRMGGGFPGRTRMGAGNGQFQGGTPSQGMPQGMPPQGMPSWGGGNPPAFAEGFRSRAGGIAGGPGGLLDSVSVGSKLNALLQTDSSKYTWIAAAVGANSAAGYQLATQKPVMPIGGFNGSDPSPTLDQFKAYVAAGKVHYFIGGGRGLGQAQGGSNTSSEISSWVTSNFTSATVDGVTIYDLTSNKANG